VQFGLWAGVVLPEPALKASFELLEIFCLICFQYGQASIIPFCLYLSFPPEAMLIDSLENTEPYVLEGHLMKTSASEILLTLTENKKTIFIDVQILEFVIQAIIIFSF